MAPALLEVTGLACRRGGRLVFDDISFSLEAGGLLALGGANGSGKTTLLRALALLVPAAAGAIRWQGAEVGADRDAWRDRIAWLGHLDGLKGDLSVRENLHVAERLRGGLPDGPHGEAVGEVRPEAALAAFDLLSLAGRAVRTLSAGQRRRAALARVVMTQAPLWLLDEPLNALDAPSQAALREVVERRLATGGVVVAATHAPLGLMAARTLELGA